KDWAARYYSIAMTYAYFGGVLLVLGLSLFAREVVVLLLSPAYAESYRVVSLVALSYLLLGMRSIVHVGMVLRRRTVAYARAFGSAAVVNVVANFLLIPRY